MKGIDILIKQMAKTECPSYSGLNDVNRNDINGECEYGNGNKDYKCIECFEKALNQDYTDK